jgi:RimJ/RimL family protein N-acetyltransferase
LLDRRADAPETKALAIGYSPALRETLFMASPGEPPILRGRRVYLRRPIATDAKEIIATVRASRRLHRPWIYGPETKAAFAGYIDRTKDLDFVGLLICRTSDDRIVGMANLSQIFLGNLRSAYLGFWASAEFAGQGYMTEGLNLVLRHAFQRVQTAPVGG